MNSAIAVMASITLVAVASILGAAIGGPNSAVLIFGFSSMVCGQLIIILRQIASDASLHQVKEDVRQIEKATNSMKDALVKATGDARFLEGKEAERTNPETKKEQL